MAKIIPITCDLCAGSVLGPFLFLIYVNDIPEAVRSRLFLFADDKKVYKVIRKAAQDQHHPVSNGGVFLGCAGLTPCPMKGYKAGNTG